MSMDHACKFFDYSISHTVLYILMVICNYLFVLLSPLTFSPIPYHSYGKVSINGLGGPRKLGGTESQEISRVGQAVLARLIESQKPCPPASSVSLLTFLSGRRLPPNSYLDGRHFIFSLYATGVPFKLLPLCRSSDRVSLCK